MFSPLSSFFLPLYRTLQSWAVCAQFIVLYHVYHSAFDATNEAEQAGQLRKDLNTAWEFIEPLFKQLPNITQQKQYHLMIFANFLAQRLQSGAKLSQLTDAFVTGIIDRQDTEVLCIPQLCCACAVLGRWADLDHLATHLSTIDPQVWSKRLEDYKDMALESLLNFDLRLLCDWAGRLAHCSADEAEYAFQHKHTRMHILMNAIRPHVFGLQL